MPAITKENLPSRVKVNDAGCWIWQGAIKNPGTGLPYGWVSFRGKQMNAHRVSWMLHFGEIPIGLEVCHSCDVPACVNPEHLFLGSHSENMKDMWSKRRHKSPSEGVEGSLSAKLSLDKVKEIRVKLANGVYQKQIAKEFGVSQATVSFINTGRNWGRYD